MTEYKSKWVDLFSKEPEITTTSTPFGVTTSCKYNIDKKDIKNNANIMIEEVRQMNNLIIKDENELYIRELSNRISKAIEYIEEHKMYNYDDICISNDIDAEELEEILKGEKDD